MHIKRIINSCKSQSTQKIAENLSNLHFDGVPLMLPLGKTKWRTRERIFPGCSKPQTEAKLPTIQYSSLENLFLAEPRKPQIEAGR